MTDPIHYRVQPSDPAAHLYAVECHIAEPDPAGQVVSLPAWIPGSYMIRDFARHIVRIEAADGHGPVALEKLDKQSWRAAPAHGPLTLRYRVYARDPSVRAAWLDRRRGFFNGTSLLLRVHGRDRLPCTLEIAAPDGEEYRHWRVATAMERVGAPRHGFGRYRAADYDELVDHPVELGEFDLVAFEAGGVEHEIAVTGRHRADLERLARDLQRICQAQIDLFGGTPPMAHYLFLVNAVGDGYGGLEHRASTALICSRDDLPAPGEEEIGEGYRTFLGLCSHEYFHTWNVKRIQPAAFVPYDLSREVHTRLLWAFEGITSYYDDLFLLRAGVIDEGSYLELLGQTVTRVLRAGGRRLQSLEESSFDAWTKFYQQDENAPNAIVSYYTKGALAALALDLTLRREGSSLDALMRALWTRYGAVGVGVPEDGVERLAAELAGRDLSGFFDLALRSTADLPLAGLLAEVGVDYSLRPAESGEDKGGKPAKKGERDAEPRAALGARVVAEAGGSKLANVYTGGAAQRAGLAAGDVVIALDGIKVGGDLEKRLARRRVGEVVTLHVFRRDELLEFPVTLLPAPEDTCWLEPAEGVEEAVRARREGWLRGG